MPNLKSRIANVFYSVMILASTSRSEVADKCPSFVSSWIVNEGAWNFLSFNEALLRLGKFAFIGGALAIGYYFLARRKKSKWFKFLPLGISTIFALFLIVDLIPQDGPCSQHILLDEMPRNLFWIQFCFYAVLILFPFCVFITLRSKR